MGARNASVSEVIKMMLIKFSLQLSRQLLKVLSISLLMSGFFYINTASAQSTTIVPDISTLIENLASTMPNLMRLVTAIAYVMGFFFVIKGLIELKKYGESRSTMSSQHELKGPLTFLAVGAALIYLPSSVRAGLSTFWTNPNPYAYITQATDPWSELLNSCFMIFQLIGIIAFIRGLILLTHIGGHGAQQGTFGRAMAHIVAGILLINMYQFIQAVINTLALGQI